MIYCCVVYSDSVVNVVHSRSIILDSRPVRGSLYCVPRRDLICYVLFHIGIEMSTSKLLGNLEAKIGGDKRFYPVID